MATENLTSQIFPCSKTNTQLCLETLESKCAHCQPNVSFHTESQMCPYTLTFNYLFFPYALTANCVLTHCQPIVSLHTASKLCPYTLTSNCFLTPYTLPANCFLTHCQPIVSLHTASQMCPYTLTANCVLTH